jgi:hypothetical protein
MGPNDPKNNLDLLFGGMSGLAGAASGVGAYQQQQADRARMERERQATSQPIDASALAQKFAQMVEGGQMSPKQAAFMYQQELQNTQGALAPQSLAPPPAQTPLPGMQSSTVGGLRGEAPPPSMGGLRGPSLNPSDLAIERAPITFSPRETKALGDLGITDTHKAKVSTQAAMDRLTSQERGRETRQEDDQKHKLELEDIKHKNRVAEIDVRVKGALDAVDKRVQGALTRFGQNPARRELITRIGQKSATLRTLYNRLIQDPRSIAMAGELEREIAALEAELQSAEAQVVTQQRGAPSASVGAPQIIKRSTHPDPAKNARMQELLKKQSEGKLK